MSATFSSNQGVTDAALVSVLVPAFNHEHYIVACLESIASAEYPQLELLFLDDGSSDQTFTLASEWIARNEKRFVRVVAGTQTNRGVTRTLNALVGQAHGDYITVVASDDMLEPQGISLRVAALEENLGWLAVFGDCLVIEDNGAVRSPSALNWARGPLFPKLLHQEHIARELILRWWVPGPSFLARRQAYDPALGVGLYDERLNAEDRDFYLRLLAVDALGFVNCLVARYRLHGKNVSLQSSSPTTREAVLSERQNIRRFSGLNKLLLTIVAWRGAALLRAHDHDPNRNRVLTWAFKITGNTLSLVRKVLYAAHVVACYTTIGDNSSTR